MVPIHDSDVADERWTKAEWEGYELWEKVELQERRKRRLWITATLLLFLILSAVPIAIEQLPKWIARSYSRQLAQEVNQLKREASIAKAPFRIRLVQTESEEQLQFVVEKVSDCKSSQGDIVRRGSLSYRTVTSRFTWVFPTDGVELGVPGLLTQFCYDPLLGSDVILRGKPMEAFGIIPVKDLSEKRLDRMALLLLSGPSAETSFD